MKMLGPIWKSAYSIWSAIKETSDQGGPKMPNIADVIRHHVFDRPVQDRHFSEAGRRQLKVMREAPVEARLQGVAGSTSSFVSETDPTIDFSVTTC